MASTSPLSWSVRVVEPGDERRWSELYAGYRAFYRLPEDPAAVATTWSWIVNRMHGLQGLVAVDGQGRVCALANLRSFARPSVAGKGLYLDDLFTDPAARRTGLGAMLLTAAAALAAEQGATFVRWITAADNAAARALYDTHATATPWVTYDMAPAAEEVGPRDHAVVSGGSTRGGTER